MRICSFPECGRKHFGHGLCNAHLNQKKKGKELTAFRPFGRKPSTFPKLSLLELVFVTAWIDAEGCITTCKSSNGKKYKRPRIRFGNSDKDIVDKLYSLTGCMTKIMTSNTGFSKKPFYSFDLNGDTAMDCMKAMMPWLSERRRAKVKEVFKECGVE